MDAAAYRRHLEREIEGYAAALERAVASGRLGRAVAACPGWDVRQLTHHLGTVHRWVVHGVTEGNGRAPAPDPVPDDELGDWFAGSAERLLATLDADPDTPCWTFAGDRTLAFWQRRQPHEHAIHRWDLQAAVGEAGTLDQDLAVDGIDEVVTMFWPRQLALGRVRELEVAVTLAPSDADRVWAIGGRERVATLSARAEAILLALWHRIPPESPGLSWSGDEGRGRAVLGLALTP